MRFNTKAEIYVSNPIPNGYGGFNKDISLFGVIDVALTPTHLDTRFVGSALYHVVTCKLFTKTELPDNIEHVIVGGRTFKVDMHNDLGKMHMLSLTLDERANG